MRTLLVATTNRGKVAELAPLLADLGIRPVGLDEYPGVSEAVEDGETFEANAEKKARHYAAATGMATLADDSGLEVDALDGAPGVHSARFAGEQADSAANNTLLLERLEGVDARGARFVCALCLVEPSTGGDAVVRHLLRGTCEGEILTTARGSGGFGYDPLFVPTDQTAGGSTFAELSREAKAALSHRGRAFADLAARLDQQGAAP